MCVYLSVKKKRKEENGAIEAQGPFVCSSDE
jgi:hypothetical protein